MKRIFLIAMAIVFFFTVPAYSEESYICVAEQSVGFKYHKAFKKWESTIFKADAKYIVSKSKRDGHGWEVKQFGNPIVHIYCMDDFNSYGNLFCSGMPEFNMNKTTLRYLLVNSHGYYYAGKDMEEGDNTPYLEIGTCHLKE